MRGRHQRRLRGEGRSADQIVLRNPEDIEAYSPLTDETGKRSFSLAIVHSVKNGFVVRIAEVATKEEADALKGSPCMHTATSCRRCLMMNSTTPTWSA